MPGERCRSLIRIKRHCHGVPKPREHVDAVREPDQHQRVVAERQVMAAVVEDVERDLSRRLGIDDHIPIPGDRGPGNRRAVTEELAARKRAMVRLSGRGRRRAGDGRCDIQVLDENWDVVGPSPKRQSVYD